MRSTLLRMTFCVWLGTTTAALGTTSVAVTDTTGDVSAVTVAQGIRLL